MSHLITEVIAHNMQVKEFRIARADGAPLPDWQPGAHVMLAFTGADGARHEKHYSLIGAPGPATAYRIAVQREEQGKGGSRTLHEEFAAGSPVELSGPFNSFPLAPAQGRVLLIAGGIGITPMISMAHALSAQDAPFELHYLARDASRLVLRDELPAAALVTHLSQESGRADLAAMLGPYADGAAFYACGPAALLQGLADAATELGWPAHAMHFESFGARTEQSDGALTVELSLSEMTVEVQPGTSILDALIAADVFVSYDCKRGECGNCYTQVQEGEPLHRDVCLTPNMRAQGMCTCVSWAKPGRLVLEL